MSDLNLLLCGCAVSFVVLGGFYFYVREAFVRQDDEPAMEPDCDEVAEMKNTEAA